MSDVLAEECVRKRWEHDWLTHTGHRITASGGVVVATKGSAWWVLRVRTNRRSVQHPAHLAVVRAGCEQATLRTLDDPTNLALGFYRHLDRGAKKVTAAHIFPASATQSGSPSESVVRSPRSKPPHGAFSRYRIDLLVLHPPNRWPTRCGTLALTVDAQLGVRRGHR